MSDTALLAFRQDDFGPTLSLPPGSEGLARMPLMATEVSAVAAACLDPDAAGSEQVQVSRTTPVATGADILTKVWVSASLLGCASLGIYAWLR